MSERIRGAGGRDVEVHGLAGAYALDALPTDEQAVFERHLSACATCRAEVEGFQDAAARLGDLVAEPPSNGLRERLLSRIDVVRQRPPRRVEELPGTAATPLWRRALPPLAAAAAAAALTLVGVQVVGEPAPSGEVVLEGTALGVLTAPDVRSVALSAPPGVPADVDAALHLSPSTGAAVVVVRGLDVLPADSTYALWLRRGEAVEPAGTVTVERGEAGALVVGDLRGVAAAQITVEPRSGVQTPTGPVVASAELPPS